MRRIAVLLVFAVAASGCGRHFVRKQGRGQRRVIAAPHAEVYAKALAQFKDLPGHVVREENGSIYIRNKPAFLHMAFHFHETNDPGKTDVETIARTWVMTRTEEGMHEKKTLDYLQLNFVPGGPEFLARMRAGDREAQMRFQRAHDLPVTEFDLSPKRSGRKHASSSVDAGMPAKPARPRDFALVVGVEDYQNAPPADWAARDAAVVKKYMIALGVPEENVILLAGEKATRSGLARYLEEWLPKNTGRDSRVYFYFSGHGAPDPATQSAYLLPWDGDPAFLKTSAYSLDRLYAKLAALPAKETVVVLDACFSGAGGRSVIAKGTRPLVSVREAAPQSGKVAVLSAAGAGQIAGGVDGEGHGLFTYHLLAGLRGGASAGKDGRLSLLELHDYVAGRVATAALRQNREQRPRLQGDGASILVY
jgi:hypothetical protein